MMIPSTSEFGSKDLAAFGKCLARLDVILLRYAAEPEDDAVCDSVIKRFELAYELSVQALYRYLIWTDPSAEKVAGLAFQDMIRRADQKGLLRSGWPKWRDYREARNRTVHTYQEQVAISVAVAARDFAQEARVLFDNLSKRMDSDG